MSSWFGALNNDGCARLLALAPPPLHGREETPLCAAPDNSALRAILFLDQTSWLPDNLLERGDRMTMGASIEARMPFLHHALAAFISALPDGWQVRGLTTQRMLRLAMKWLLAGAYPAKAQSRLPRTGQRVVPHVDARLSARTPQRH
jgi:asparagine synthase (glutamine-hydrolysing)